ncbi:hypothetical protein Tco_0979216 [Tanacetum coccineum]
MLPHLSPNPHHTNEFSTISVAVSDVPGDGSRMHTHDHGGSEALDGSPDSILSRSGYQQKDRKPSQNDKTEHGMEKTVQNQGQSPKMPKSESILKNQQSNRSRI